MPEPNNLPPVDSLTCVEFTPTEIRLFRAIYCFQIQALAFARLGHTYLSRELAAGRPVDAEIMAEPANKLTESLTIMMTCFMACRNEAVQSDLAAVADAIELANDCSMANEFWQQAYKIAELLEQQWDRRQQDRESRAAKARLN